MNTGSSPVEDCDSMSINRFDCWFCHWNVLNNLRLVYCQLVFGQNPSIFLHSVHAYYNYHPHLCYVLVELMIWWYIWTLQLKANGESFLLCESWSIYGGYERRIWTIWEGTSAGMPLHAMVPWKTTCWSSLSSATATGSSLWDQDKGFLLSGTSTLTKSFLSHFMLFNCCEYFLAWASFNFYQVYLVAIIVLCYFECFKFIVSKRVVLLLEVERDLEKQ